MIISKATRHDLARLLQFRVDASAWLHERGIDQWSSPFPADHITRSIDAGETYLVKDAGSTAATVTIDRHIDPELWDLWTPQERAENALYAHKLTVDRAYRGQDLGGRILTWAGDLAFRQGAQWLRLEAWTSNHRLHQYYTDHGFQHVRTTQDPHEVCGWLAQKPAARNDTHGLTQTAESPASLAGELARD